MIMHESFKQVIEDTIHGEQKMSCGEQLSAAIFGIALSTRGKKFLELGVHTGGTTLPLLNAANLLGGHLTSVDITQHTFNCPDDFKNRWTFIVSDAIEFLRKNTEKYDLIFIDDWHDGIHVFNELNLLAPYCDKNTLILLHDCMARTYPDYRTEDGYGEFGNGGVYRAVNSMNKFQWEFSTLPFSHGLTILRKII